MNEEFVDLAQRIRDALPDLERVVGRAEALRDKAVRTGDDGYWDGVALNLHSFYSGAEDIFEDIAQVVDDDVPSGVEWHYQLLKRMSEVAPDARPEVISSDTRDRIDNHRKFRHIARNVYAFNLRPARLQELTDAVRPCLDAVSSDLRNFISFLEQVAHTDEASDGKTDN